MTVALLILAAFVLVMVASAPRPAIRWSFFAVAVIGLALGPPGLAFAQTVAPPPSVSLPIGAWITDIGGFLMLIVPAALGWLLRHLPAQIVAVIKSTRADQLIEKAIDYAINAVENAEAGKTLSVPVANAVVAQATQYVIDHGPATLINWLGGESMISQKVIARLNIEPAAAVATTDEGKPVLVKPAAPAAQ